MIFLNGSNGVSEENDCVGSFRDRTKGRARPLAWLSICLFFGEVVGTEGGERLVCCRSRGRAGLGPLYDDGCCLALERRWVFDGRNRLDFGLLVCY